MKIWLQSGSGLSANGGTPNSRLYEDAVARRLEGVARAGTDCVVFGIGSTPFGKDRYHAAKQKVFTGLIESVLRAEPEGYDAVGVINTFDHRYYELRELLRIPVVFIIESTLYLACQLAPTFAVIGHNWQIKLSKGTRKSLRPRIAHAEGASLNLTYDDVPRMCDDPPAYLDRFREPAGAAI